MNLESLENLSREELYDLRITTVGVLGMKEVADKAGELILKMVEVSCE